MSQFLIDFYSKILISLLSKDSKDNFFSKHIQMRKDYCFLFPVS